VVPVAYVATSVKVVAYGGHDEEFGAADHYSIYRMWLQHVFTSCLLSR